MDDQLKSGFDNTGEIKRAVEDTMEQARTMATNATEQVWSAAADASAAAQDLTVKAREQTAIARDMLYQQGARAGEYVNAYPLTALFMAGALGYGLAYLMHRSSGSANRM